MKLRWGILSTARIADQLVRGIRLSNNGELVAVASRDLERARTWAHNRDVPHAFGSYEEMLASDVVDAVYIPLPNALHREWTIRAAQAHKHVLCEKPLASDAAQVREMIEAADSNRVRLMEAFMYRFHPEWKQVQEMIAAGAIGEVKIIRGTFDFILNRPNDIRLSPELAGGALMDVGCYPVNAARMIAGIEPVAVQGSAIWTRTQPQVIVPLTAALPQPQAVMQAIGSVDEALAGVLEFPNGVLALIDCSFRTELQRVVISGTQGRLEVPAPFRMSEEEMSILYDHGAAHEVRHAPGANEYHKMVEHFADAVLNDQPLAYPPQSSFNQMRVLDALYESARTGKRVEL